MVSYFTAGVAVVCADTDDEEKMLKNKTVINDANFMIDNLNVENRMINAMYGKATAIAVTLKTF